ncbi:MAG: hypothetical protein ACYTKD_08205 [Planctomycetota bacterium]
MKKISVVVVCILVVGAALFLVWLHDLRASGAVSELQQEAADKRLVISKLEKNTGVLREFVASDDPMDTRLAAEIRRQNSQLGEDEFRQWLRVNAPALRGKVQDDIGKMPAVIAARKQELADIQSRLDRCARPWVFSP